MQISSGLSTVLPLARDDFAVQRANRVPTQENAPQQTPVQPVAAAASGSANILPAVTGGNPSGFLAGAGGPFAQAQGRPGSGQGPNPNSAQIGSQNTGGSAQGSNAQGTGEAQENEGLLPGLADEAVTEDGEENGAELTEEEQQVVTQLRARDREVRQHEQAHAAVGGQYAGAPTYDYTTGPDGNRYATGGEVSIDASAVPDDPQATIVKMQIVKAAALAPAEPSAQDRRVAALADQQRIAAQAQLAAERQEEARGEGEGEAEEAPEIPSNNTADASDGAQGQRAEGETDLPGQRTGEEQPTLPGQQAAEGQPPLPGQPAGQQAGFSPFGSGDAGPAGNNGRADTGFQSRNGVGDAAPFGRSAERSSDRPSDSGNPFAGIADDDITGLVRTAARISNGGVAPRGLSVDFNA